MTKTTPIDINERMLASLSQPGDLDVDCRWGGLVGDESYPFRILSLGAYAISALIRARKAQQNRAISYRDFNVGATVVAANPAANKIAMFSGYNAKVDSTDLINIHAEDIALNKARLFGATVVPLLVVVGDLQPDQTSGQDTTTLHPCSRCRAKFLKSDLITDNTVLMSATPNLGHIQIYDLPNLLNFHNGQADADIRTFKMHQFQPDALGDTPWDIDWDHNIGPYLLEKYHLAFVDSI